MSIVNGLHEFASDDPELAAAAAPPRRVDPRRAQDRPALGAPLLERRDPLGRGSSHRRPRNRLRPRQAHDGALPPRGLPRRRPRDRADLHGADRLDAGRAVRLRPRLHSERLRLGRARARDRVLLEGAQARSHPPRGAIGPAQPVRTLRIGVPRLGTRRGSDPAARSGPRRLRRPRGVRPARSSGRRRDRPDPPLRGADARRDPERRGHVARRRCASSSSGCAGRLGIPVVRPLEDGVGALLPGRARVPRAPRRRHEDHESVEPPRGVRARRGRTPSPARIRSRRSATSSCGSRPTPASSASAPRRPAST